MTRAIFVGPCGNLETDALRFFAQRIEIDSVPSGSVPEQQTAYEGVVLALVSASAGKKPIEKIRKINPDMPICVVGESYNRFLDRFEEVKQDIRAFLIVPTNLQAVDALLAMVIGSDRG